MLRPYLSIGNDLVHRKVRAYAPIPGVAATMTPDERDRLARLEQQTIDTRDDIAEIKGDVKSLLAAFNMGQGAWKATLKFGVLLSASIGAAAWIYQNFLSPLLTGKH